MYRRKTWAVSCQKSGTGEETHTRLFMQSSKEKKIYAGSRLECRTGVNPGGMHAEPTHTGGRVKSIGIIPGVQHEENPGWEHRWNLALGGNPGGSKARVQNGGKPRQDSTKRGRTPRQDCMQNLVRRGKARHNHTWNLAHWQPPGGIVLIAWDRG